MTPTAHRCAAARIAAAVAALVLSAWCPAQSHSRVIVIGVDGFDYEVCRDLMTAGDLPALTELSEAGSFIPLYPANPAQSPVSWATMTTGRNPGSTGVFDFLRAVPGAGGEGVAAELALVRRRDRREEGPVTPGRAMAFGIAALAAALLLWARGLRRLAFVAGVVVPAGLAAAAAAGAVRGSMMERLPENGRRGDAVWERLDRQGVPTMSLLAPMAFPAPDLDHGHLLCGLGVPDVMGTPGTVTVFREEPVPAGRGITPTGCRVRSIRDTGDGRLEEVSVSGPRPDPDRPRLEVPVDARVLRDARSVAIGVGRTDVVAEGEWSPFQEVRFSLPWLGSLHALARHRVLEAGRRVVLYQEPPCFDPRNQPPALPITSPPSFGSELCADGLFDTLGWPCATNPFQDEVIDEATFLADIAEIERQREALLWRSLAKPGWKMFFCVLSTPDRVQHMFWRDRDPGHPRHDPGAIARRGDPIRESYRRIDALVGRVRREVVRPGDLFLVVSDHGFAPFRYAVNLNRFLAEEGYLVGAGDRRERTLETSLGPGASLFPGVDWARTRAYSLGLGKIYVHGNLSPAARRQLLEEIRGKLLALRHDGKPVVRSARLREEIYKGEHVQESADLVIGFERGFRVSWQCTLGSLDEPVIAPNRSLWSGDHCSVDPELVAGVLFSSHRLDQSAADVADVCPTIETALGVEPAADEDGRPLRFRKR